MRIQGRTLIGITTQCISSFSPNAKETRDVCGGFKDYRLCRRPLRKPMLRELVLGLPKQPKREHYMETECKVLPTKKFQHNYLFAKPFVLCTQKPHLCDAPKDTQGLW